MHCTTEIPGVKIMVRTTHFDFQCQLAADGISQRRTIRSQHAGVRHHSKMSAQRPAVPLNEACQIWATDFFFALKQAYQIDWQRTWSADVGFDRFEVSQQLAFIVTGTAPKQVVVAYGRFEWGRDPFRKRVGRLHVVVTVDDRRWHPWGVPPFSINNRM